MNIVLSHGILGFGHLDLGHVEIIHYFRGVAEAYRAQGHKVIEPAVDRTKGVEFRGNQLRDQIESAFTGSKPELDPDPKVPTHIIAHSMGGLDSRFILSPANEHRINRPIRSLTTISTPHRGSPIADLLATPEQTGIFPRLLDLPIEEALGGLGISLDGLRDLTTRRCEVFNQKFTNDPAVAYLSVAGDGSQIAILLRALHAYIIGKTGLPNDGLVTVESAKFGQFDPETWPLDHAMEVGYDLDHLAAPPAGHGGRYQAILDKLTNLPKLP